MQIIRGKLESAQKVVIYGPEGIGKSTFAAQFPDPVFIDTEGSTKHMDVARLPKPSSWTMLLEQVKYIKNNPNVCKTLAIDTADWAELLCIEDICARFKKDGIEEFGYGKGYVYLAEEYGRFLNLLEDLIDLGINVVLSAHAMMRKFEQPDEMGAYDRWEMKLQRKTAPLVKEWADMVLFANYKTYVVKTDDKKNKAQGGKRIMYTSHHPCWDAKNRHNLPEEIPLDYSAIAHCIPGKPSVQHPPQQPQQPPRQESPFLEDDPALTKKPEPSKPEQASPKQDPPEQESPKQEPPKQDTQKVPESQEKPYNEDLSGIPKPLADLMLANKVTTEEIQHAVASRGYYPRNTPIQNYDPDFINGVLVGAWPQVFKMIQDFRNDVPF